MRAVVGGLIVLFCAAGCSSGPPAPVELVGFESLSPRAKQVVDTAWPRIKAKFPGLHKYGDSVKVVAIEDMMSDRVDTEYRKVTIKLQVPYGKSSVPTSYGAFGHSCYLDISSDGSTVSVAKRPCKALLLDMPIDGTGNEHDNGNDMVVSLQ